MIERKGQLTWFDQSSGLFLKYCLGLNILSFLLMWVKGLIYVHTPAGGGEVSSLHQLKENVYFTMSG